jgi:hypothetical protein
MNYATDYTVILTALYVLMIAIAFSPKCPQTVSPDRPIDYFPVVEADPEPETAIALNPSFPDLASMTIRQLKALASQVKLPRYSSLTKSQLIVKLSQWEPILEV